MGTTDHWEWEEEVSLMQNALVYEGDTICMVASNPQYTVHRVMCLSGSQGLGTDETMTGSLDEAKASALATLRDLGWAIEKDPIRGGQVI